MTQCIILSGGTWNPETSSKIQRSLGPYRLSSALKDAGYNTFVLDYVIELTSEEIINTLKTHLTEDTLWVGFSSTFFFRNTSKTEATERMYYDEYNTVNKVIQYIKNNSNAKIIYGGAKTIYYTGRDNNIDYYITGYADVSLVELTDYISGKSKVMPPHEVIDVEGTPAVMIDSFNYPEPKLDNIKTYWWEKNYNILPKEALPIELARGCIFKCKFCNYPLLGKKKGTYLRDPEEIRDELIKINEAHGTTNFYITDDTFNDDNNKIESLHKVFTSLPFKPQFSSYLRIDLLNKYPHQAELLKEMGLIGTYFGLETTQAQSARAIGKGLHPNKVKDRLYWLKEKWNNKVNIESGFILGLPYDTTEYFNELITWCLEKDNPIDYIAFYPLYLFKYSTVATPENMKKLEKYLSDFSINPEIYGYEFNGINNITNWNLPSQNLNYDICTQLANKFNGMVSKKNKISGFSMLSHLNLDIKLEDLYNLTQEQIKIKYNIPELNKQKIHQYKQLL